MANYKKIMFDEGLNNLSNLDAFVALCVAYRGLTACTTYKRNGAIEP